MNFESIKDIVLTDSEKEKFKYMDNDNGRKTIAYIFRLPNDVLRPVLDEVYGKKKKRPKFDALMKKMGDGTNPLWLEARVAEVLYERGEIDEEIIDAIAGY